MFLTVERLFNFKRSSDSSSKTSCCAVFFVNINLFFVAVFMAFYLWIRNQGVAINHWHAFFKVFFAMILSIGTERICEMLYWLQTADT